VPVAKKHARSGCGVQKVRRTQSEGLVAAADRWRGAGTISGLGRCDAVLDPANRPRRDRHQRDQAKLQAEVLALRRQVQVLERQIKRVNWTPADRMVLAALRDRLPRSAWAALRVQPETVLGWHRQLVRRRWAAYRNRPSRGRPPLSAECRELVVRMARENSRWGYFRIRGELLKLGYTVSATTIRSLLRRAHVPPAGRRSELTWKQFLAAHADTLVATDFFSVDTVFFKRLYVLMFVHIGTRRVLATACTSEPNSAWVTQQARNLSWQLEDDGLKLSLVIHDHDRKFPSSFDSIFGSGGARVILTPLMAPRANAHAERWVGSCRRECLDWMLIVSERHLRAVLREYCAHYNHERPHRSRGLRPPSPRVDHIPHQRGNTITRRERLGGLLSEYYVEPKAA
jgi:putative transposase